MKLHEFQTKSIFRQEGIPVPTSFLASNSEQAKQIAAEIGFPVVLKAQVLVAGRGRAGGVRLVKNEDEAEAASNAILNLTIKGISVQHILVEKAYNPARELYVGITRDPEAEQTMLVLSNEGGLTLEDPVRSPKSSLVKVMIDPLVGLQDFMTRAALSELRLDPLNWRAIGQVVSTMWSLYDKLDATLIEINSLALTETNQPIALDTKLILDDSALFRQRQFAVTADPAIVSFMQGEANKFGLGYMRMTGTFGCMVNGIGLAFATLDTLSRHDVEPANLVDIGGGAIEENIASALRIIITDENVKTVLVNIFGGITRCDEVARGILRVKDAGTPLPEMFVRLAGRNAAEGIALLQGQPGVTIYGETDEMVKATVLAQQEMTL